MKTGIKREKILQQIYIPIILGLLAKYVTICIPGISTHLQTCWAITVVMIALNPKLIETAVILLILSLPLQEELPFFWGWSANILSLTGALFILRPGYRHWIIKKSNRQVYFLWSILSFTCHLAIFIPIKYSLLHQSLATLPPIFPGAVYEAFLTSLISTTLLVLCRQNDFTRQSKKRYHKIISKDKNGHFLMDLTGNFLEVNQSFCSISGHTKKELLKMNLFDCIPKNEREVLRENIVHNQRLKEGLQKEYKTDFIQKGSKIIPLALQIRPNIDEDAYIENIWGCARDISERNQIKEEHIASEKKWRSYFDHAPYGVFITDKTGKYLEVNPAACRITGYTESELLKMSIPDLISDEDQEIAQEHFSVLQQKGKSKGEMAFLHKDKSIRYLDVSAARISDDRYIGFTEDITEKKEVLEEIQKSKLRFEKTLNVIPDMVSINDSDMTILYSNWKGFAAVAPEKQRRKTKCYQTYRNRTSPCPDCHAKIVIQTKQTHQVETKLPDGRWIDLRVIPILNETQEVEMFVEWVRDITQHKKAEEELHAREERFQTLVNDIPMIAIQGYAPDGTTLYWNKGSQEIYGYAQEEAIGKNLINLIVPPIMCTGVQQTMKKMAQTGVPEPASELTLMKKDGTLIDVYSCHSILKKPGQPQELFCIDIDLSEIKKSEREKKKLQDQLTQAQKMESIGRLAGGVAHDFNNMLNIIMGYSDMVTEKLDINSPVLESIDEIQEAARRSADLTRQLLAFARQQAIQPKMLSLNKTVQAMIKMLRRLIGEDIQLTWKPETHLQKILIDPAQIDQILVNLVVNARDAINKDGQITIETAESFFAEEDCPENLNCMPGTYAMLSVSDNGKGFSDAEKNRIFEPFYTTKKLGKGTGLGLSTVYGIVQQNNGFINVDSKVGQGTTFSIYFRIHSEEDSSMEKQSETQHQNSTGEETILLVEDEPGILKLGTKMLKSMGYQVLFSKAPKNAIKIASEYQEPIHLLITDVVMPGMNGKDLSLKIKELYPGIKCIFMSGYTADVIAQKGVIEEGVLFIQKPFTRKELSTIVRKALDLDS